MTPGFYLQKLTTLVIAVFIGFVCCADDGTGTPNNGGNGNTDHGDNTLTVSSVTVERGEEDVRIPVLLSNDATLRAIVVPLVIREVDPGAFITSMKLSFADRLSPDGPLNELRITSQYEPGVGSCKEGEPGGFGAIAFGDTLPHPVTAAPAGVLFSRNKIIGDNFLPGADTEGSCVITVDVTNTAGRFEIDSTCTNPANHLMFITPDNTPIIPAFTKGTITIE